MYVPPFVFFASRLGLKLESVFQGGHVTIPIRLFKTLLEVAVRQSPFDESEYLSRNRDVAESIAAGELADGKTHFVTTGYFLGRRGGLPFDEVTYRRLFSDVSDAIRKGDITSAEDHYYASGALEGRASSSETQSEAMFWLNLLESWRKEEVDPYEKPNKERDVRVSKQKASFFSRPYRK